MPFKPKINIQLIQCGTCGKKYNNPLTHVCKVRIDKAAPRGSKAAKQAAAKRAAVKKKRK